MTDTSTQQSDVAAAAPATSTMTLGEACAETQKFARMLKGMERLGEVAAALSSADQAVADRRREEAVLIASLAQKQAELADLDGKLEVARGAAKQTEKDSQDKAKRVVDDARAEATRLRTEARSALEVAKNDVTNLQAQASAAERRRDEAVKELDLVTKRIADAKAEGRKIFGG